MPDTIDKILDKPLPEGKIRPIGRRILRLYFLGKTPSEIAEEVGEEKGEETKPAGPDVWPVVTEDEREDAVAVECHVLLPVNFEKSFQYHRLPKYSS